MATRICTKCCEEKELEINFGWSIKGIKRHSRCNKCRNEDRLERYHRNPEPELEYKYERQARRREELRQYVFEYLSSHVCADCGEYDPLVLSFRYTFFFSQIRLFVFRISHCSELFQQAGPICDVVHKLDEASCINNSSRIISRSHHDFRIGALISVMAGDMPAIIGQNLSDFSFFR